MKNWLIICPKRKLKDMELKLEDYAKREHRMWYEIMKEQTKKSHLNNKLTMFVRPSSGWVEVWSFIPQEDGSKMGLDLGKRSLESITCYLEPELWQDMSIREPPWKNFGANEFLTIHSLKFVPSFALEDYARQAEGGEYRYKLSKDLVKYLSNLCPLGLIFLFVSVTSR